MADSVKLKVLKNIKSTLLGITTGAGFQNTLTNVQLFSMLGNEKVDVPVVIISSDLETRDEGMSQIVRTLFSVYVTLYHAQQNGDTTPSDQFLDSLYQDILKALLTDRTRGGVAVDTDVQEVQHFQLEDNQMLYGLSFKLEIEFRTDPADVTADR